MGVENNETAEAAESINFDTLNFQFLIFEPLEAKRSRNCRETAKNLEQEEATPAKRGALSTLFLAPRGSPPLSPRRTRRSEYRVLACFAPPLPRHMRHVPACAPLASWARRCWRVARKKKRRGAEKPTVAQRKFQVPLALCWLPFAAISLNQSLRASLLRPSRCRSTPRPHFAPPKKSNEPSSSLAPPPSPPFSARTTTATTTTTCLEPISFRR